mgnify:CR=1 FL=1
MLEFLKSDKWQGPVIIVAMLCIFVSALMPILKVSSQVIIVARYVYAVAAGVMLVARLFERYRGSSLRIARLHRLEKWSAAMYCVSAFMLIYNYSSSFGARDWLAFLLAGAVIQLYSSIAIEFEERKIAHHSKEKEKK